jgi:hypothetical protein
MEGNSYISGLVFAARVFNLPNVLAGYDLDRFLHPAQNAAQSAGVVEMAVA